MSGLLITAVLGFGAGYSFVHENEHNEIRRLQAALESANTQVNGVYLAGEKRAAIAKNETAMLNNKLEQAHNNASNLDIQLHVQDDKTCLKPRKQK